MIGINTARFVKRSLTGQEDPTGAAWGDPSHACALGYHYTLATITITIIIINSSTNIIGNSTSIVQKSIIICITSIFFMGLWFECAPLKIHTVEHAVAGMLQRLQLNINATPTGC